MNRAIAQDQIKALGLAVSPAGIISAKGYDYGTLQNTDLHTMDNRFIPLDDVDHLSWVAEENEMRAIMKDGTEERIHADVYTQKDTEMIELRMMPTSAIELEDIFEELYPDIHDRVYYDELNEHDMVDMSLFGEGGGIQPLSDKSFSCFMLDIQRRLRQGGYVGKRYPTERMCELVLNKYTYSHRRNMFREWVEAHPWDGKPRVNSWFRDLFGATAPPLQDMGLEDEYLSTVSEMWFVGVIRRQYEPTKHEIVPVLISPQGIGKGNLIRFMAGQDCWYVESTQSVKYIDKFLDSIRGAIVVELSESKQLKDDDANLLKSFISTISDQLRKPYARYDDRYPRHFGLIATSNEDDMFTDATGNRRYFPMYCDASESKALTRYDVEQVWAEALHMYREGRHWYMSKDFAEVAAIMQDYGSEEDPNVDMIERWLDDPVNGYAEIGDRVSRPLLMDKVFGVDPDTVRAYLPKNVKDAIDKWASGTKSWRKVSKTVRIDGKVCRAWERVALPGTRQKLTRLKTLDTMDKSAFPSEDNDPTAFMRRYCELHPDHVECGDIFDVSDVDQHMLEALLAEAYIYESYADDSGKVYKVAMRP